MLEVSLENLLGLAGEKAPRHASFGEEEVSDKPSWIRERRTIYDRQACREAEDSP